MRFISVPQAGRKMQSDCLPAFSAKRWVCHRIPGGSPYEEIDFTAPAAREREYHFGAQDLVVIGSPVYADRLPNKIMPDFRRCFSGEGTIAVPVVAYGNRSFGGALTELCMILQEAGFRIAGGAALVCRHSIADALAAGRPDEKDRDEIRDFADQIANKLNDPDGFEPLVMDPDEELPPYYTPRMEDGTPAKFLKAKPETDEEKCIRCGICRDACPMGSINEDMQVEGVCIKCQACVKSCPKQAKHITDEAFLGHMRMLEKNYVDHRAENYFL